MPEPCLYIVRDCTEIQAVYYSLQDFWQMETVGKKKKKSAVIPYVLVTCLCSKLADDFSFWNSHRKYILRQ